MRLIDVDELSAKLRNIYEHEKDVINSVWRLNTLIDKVDEIPTAYDPEKVVAQLEKEFKKYYGENWNKSPYLVKAIKIVKDGGTDEEKRHIRTEKKNDKE